MDPRLSLAPLLAPPARLDMARSRALAAQLNAQPQQPYLNSLRAQRGVPDACYVEGIVVTDRDQCPCTHAWLEAPDRTILDVTPSRHVSDPSARYFAAHRWTLADITALMQSHRGRVKVPLTRYLPDNGREELSYLDATIAVTRHRSALWLKDRGAPLYTPTDERLRDVVGSYWLTGRGAKQLEALRAESSVVDTAR